MVLVVLIACSLFSFFSIIIYYHKLVACVAKPWNDITMFIELFIYRSNQRWQLLGNVLSRCVIPSGAAITTAIWFRISFPLFIKKQLLLTAQWQHRINKSASTPVKISNGLVFNYNVKVITLLMLSVGWNKTVFRLIV
jgi:hypothetical protein